MVTSRANLLQEQTQKHCFEKTKITEIIRDMDIEICELEEMLEKQKMLKQGMMQVLLTGKIRLI